MTLALARVRIEYDDGTSVEAEVTPSLARALELMDLEDQRNDRKQRRRVVTATDMGKDANQWQDKRTISPWEGPRPRFSLLLGDSAVLGGPASYWLKEVTEDGVTKFAPCAPGDEPIADDDGRVRARKGGVVRCRCCGHFRNKLPPYAACLNATCSRTGRDSHIKPVPPRIRRRAFVQDGEIGGRGALHAKMHGKHTTQTA